MLFVESDSIIRDGRGIPGLATCSHIRPYSQSAKGNPVALSKPSPQRSPSLTTRTHIPTETGSEMS